MGRANRTEPSVARAVFAMTWSVLLTTAVGCGERLGATCDESAECNDDETCMDGQCEVTDTSPEDDKARPALVEDGDDDNESRSDAEGTGGDGDSDAMESACPPCSGTTPACDQATGTCVACKDGLDCPFAACDLATGACRPAQECDRCLSDEDCGAGLRCYDLGSYGEPGVCAEDGTSCQAGDYCCSVDFDPVGFDPGTSVSTCNPNFSCDPPAGDASGAVWPGDAGVADPVDDEKLGRCIPGCALDSECRDGLVCGRASGGELGACVPPNTRTECCLGPLCIYYQGSSAPAGPPSFPDAGPPSFPDAGPPDSSGEPPSGADCATPGIAYVNEGQWRVLPNPSANRSLAADADTTEISMFGVSPEPIEAVLLGFPAAVGTYACGPASGSHELAFISQADGASPAMTRVAGPDAGSCTITVTEVGAVGEPIRGTFSAVLEGDRTVELTNGCFHAIRGADR